MDIETDTTDPKGEVASYSLRAQNNSTRPAYRRILYKQQKHITDFKISTICCALPINWIYRRRGR